MRRIVLGNIENGEEEKSENLGFIEIEGPHAEVEVKVGYTKNLGNFQSKRIDVSIRVPCSPKDVDAAHKWANDWAWNKMLESSNPPDGARDEKDSGSSFSNKVDYEY